MSNPGGGQDADLLWGAFETLPGVRYHFDFRHFGGSPLRQSDRAEASERRPYGWGGSGRLRDVQGAVLAEMRIRHHGHLWVGSRYFQVSHRGERGEPAVIVAMETDEVVADVTGVHFNRKATTELAFADGRVVSFPVSGTRKSEAVMVAEQTPAQPIAHLRLVRAGLGRTCQIVVSPHSLSGDDLALLLLFGGWIFRNYFLRPTGGA